MGKWQRPNVKFNRHRYRRALNLRRAIIPHILLAGTRPPAKGEKGPQQFVCLTDALDDVLYNALERERQIVARQKKGGR